MVAHGTNSLVVSTPKDISEPGYKNPELHERWDARFTSITYLPRIDESQPQRFRYSTRIGFGLAIDGEGEAVGSHNDGSGRRTSSLRF